MASEADLEARLLRVEQQLQALLAHDQADDRDWLELEARVAALEQGKVLETEPIATGSRRAGPH